MLIFFQGYPPDHLRRDVRDSRSATGTSLNPGRTYIYAEDSTLLDP